ncbi:MAG: peptidoglycan-binding protein [Cyanobacteriota bacterium]|nr:peptidoglycan-binding protein [Cyanobacteriota bacterium]
MNKLSKFFISAAIAGTVLTAASAAQALTLKTGATGYNVRIMQTELRNRGFFPKNVSSTGYYGSITKAAVMRFQRANGLRADGIAGPATLRAMGYAGTGGSRPVDQFQGANGVVRVRTKLNVRAGAGTNYRVLGTLPPGQSVSIVNERNGWYQLETPEGEYWVHSKYISIR